MDMTVILLRDRNSRVLSQDNAARVISLNLNSKEISIYRREGREVMTSQDLVDVIQGSSPE
jgi:hypothetical protein